MEQERIKAVQSTVSEAKEKSEEGDNGTSCQIESGGGGRGEMKKVDGRYERARVGCLGASVLLTMSYM